MQYKRREVDWIGHSLCRNCLLKRVIEGMIIVKDRSGRKKREKTSAIVWQENERILENERGRSRSQSVEKWLWKRVWTCKTHCAMCEWMYEGCPESVEPFWISWEPVAWPWCNLAASQRRPYYAKLESHSPVGLVSRQWDAVDWAYVLCDRRILFTMTGRAD